MEWQYISTAPKDGTVIFVHAPGYEWPEAVFYEKYDELTAASLGEDGFWRYAETTMAEICPDAGEDTWTHWMPLPSPPKPITPKEKD